MPDAIHGRERRPLVAGRSLFDYADDLALLVPASCRRTGRCHECIVAIQAGAPALSPRTAEERFLPGEFRLACQAVIERADSDVEFSVLRRRLRILMAPEGPPLDVDPSVSVADGRIRVGGWADSEGGAESVDHWGDLGPVRGRLVGLAVDLGTTSVVLELVDLATGATLAAGAFENPQAFGGSDVMSRISYDADHPGELRQAVRRALNHELKQLYAGLRIGRSEVVEAVVVGNSTMRDLFFGLDVGPIGRHPYRSTTETELRMGMRASTAIVRRAHELGLLVHPRARVIGGPLIAGHVGADAAADLVAIGVAGEAGAGSAGPGDEARPNGPMMLIDVGTNTEVVVGAGGRYLAASCPAGPAFEGGLIGSGMPGAIGAIEVVHLGPAGTEGVDYRTIGAVDPEGICGSGLVDLLAELRRTGRLNERGAFADGARSFDLVPERGIGLSRADISQLAQAKAAMAAGQRILLRALGVTADRIERLYLAGAFANSLDVAGAVAIGMLAPVPAERVVKVGNASVRGAKALLLSRRRRTELEVMVRRIEHVELEAEPDFFELFADGLLFEPLAA
jgi:uncharacterized 2Fe-2S/4Fe-4S cluster protein (DUF4445 family)